MNPDDQKIWCKKYRQALRELNYLHDQLEHEGGELTIHQFIKELPNADNEAVFLMMELEASYQIFTKDD